MSLECDKSSLRVFESKVLPQNNSKTCDKSSSKVFKSKVLPQKISKTTTIDDIGVEKSKSNEYTLSLGNNSKKSSSNLQSKSNDCPVSLECDKSSSKVSMKKLLQLKSPNQMNVL